VDIQLILRDIDSHKGAFHDPSLSMRASAALATVRVHGT